MIISIYISCITYLSVDERHRILLNTVTISSSFLTHSLSFTLSFFSFLYILLKNTCTFCYSVYDVVDCVYRR